MDDFESLLKQQDYINSMKPSERSVIELNPVSRPQKADKSATLFDFIKMVDKLVSLTMPNVLFMPDEGKVFEMDGMKKIEKPFITYCIKSREPLKELKYRIRETVDEQVYAPEDQRKGEIWGQKFKCVVQFNIFTSVYTEAEAVMEKFEELITMYTGFFKKNGVGEVLFQKHFTDEAHETLRETLSVRNLCYYVEIEKLTVIFREKIKEIEILAQEQGGN